uniref:Uncharacterized protein n=1 Tax=Amphimedon queenslandica TaxID=400682 RepID=A0A1X7V6J1_AMPQE
MINPYNPDLLKAWIANMDIQVVGNVYGAAKYVCHYMCKDKLEQIKQQIARKLDELPVNCSQRQNLLKFGNVFNKSQDPQCSEAVFCITSLHLRGSSQLYVFINTNRPEKRGRLFTSNRELVSMSTGDDDVFNPGPLERHQSHPN